MKTFYLKFNFALIAICFLVNLNLKAQETSFAPAHLKAAQDLMIAMKEPEKMTTTMDNLIAVQSKNLPSNKQQAFSDAMRKFMIKYL